VTTLEGRVDRDGTDTHRLRLARGDVRVVLVKARSKVTVTVRDSDGDRVLSRRGAARFAAVTEVPRGAYRVLVAGKPGLRYKVRLVT